MGHECPSGRGTEVGLKCRTIMNANSRSKAPRASRLRKRYGKPSPCSQKRKGKGTFQGKRNVAQRPTVLRPGQRLLICLGWLRLFQRIITPTYGMGRA
jgi:hypothetical protein